MTSVSNSALAQTNDVIGTISNLPVPTDVTKTSSFISVIIVAIYVIGGLFTLWQIIMGGFTYITAGGDKGKVQEAQNKIFMAITGLIIIGASFLIIGVISLILFGDFNAILNPGSQLQTL